jgi:aldose 1-epimerase
MPFAKVAAVRGVSLCTLLVLSVASGNAQYSAHRDGDVVKLEDASHKTVVSILPSVGDIIVGMTVNGQEIVHFPYASVDAFKARPGLAGIPFLGPWANRLDEDAFYANGKKYNFNMTLGNVRGAIPMHGFLTQTPFWEVVELKADKNAAWLTSKLDFYKHPDWMEQFPFAHTIEITQRLEGGVLQVQTRIDNLSTDPMPVAIGFHPYYQLTDSKREDWVLSVGARQQWLLAPTKVPTGETRPIEAFFPDPKAVQLKDFDLDHAFADLIRDANGRSTFTVTGKKQKLEIQFGPKYLAAVLYSPDPNAQPQFPTGAGSRPPQNSAGGAPPTGPPQMPAGAPRRPPPDPNFICFEPMAAMSDALNLAQKGLYKDLQYIPAGGTWSESFWIKPSGF